MQRGDILDVYPMASPDAFRLEFFDDEHRVQAIEEGLGAARPPAREHRSGVGRGGEWWCAPCGWWVVAW